MSSLDLTARLFLQLAVLLAACRVVGAASRALGQPAVVGEMITGILLGPTVLGALAPDAQAWLFPPETAGMLAVLAHLGLALTMFVVGAELDLRVLSGHRGDALVLSLAGILAPFALGGLLGWWVAGDTTLFAASVRPFEAALFVGAAMSITAFPMLARIIHERGLTNTPLGSLALSAGAFDDAAAWGVLAVVLASFRGHPALALTTIGGGLAYAWVVLRPGRRVLARLGAVVEREGGVSPAMLSTMLALVLLCAWFTDTIGMYAVFGTFLLGVALPRGRLAQDLGARIEPLATGLLLPVFFVSSGLRTHLQLVDTPRAAALAAAVVLVACLGKGVACGLAARRAGLSRRDAVGIGALMNSRGLMELILLNLGYEHGLITQSLFSILVAMAVVTTLLATPVFDRTRRGGVA